MILILMKKPQPYELINKDMRECDDCKSIIDKEFTHPINYDGTKKYICEECFESNEMAVTF